MTSEHFIWKHYTVLQKPDKSTKHPRVQCLYCNHEFTAGTTRCCGHILGVACGVSACPNPPAQWRKQLKEEAERKQAEQNNGTEAVDYKATYVEWASDSDLSDDE